MSGRHTISQSRRAHLVTGALVGVAAVGTTVFATVGANTAQAEPKKAHQAAPAAKVKAAKAAAPHKAATAAAVIKIAKSQVGITENSAGGGTKFQKWYMANPQAGLAVKRDGGSLKGYSDASWCDMFVSWVGQQAHATGMGIDAYTPAHAGWFKKHGRFGKVAKPGAVVFYNWDGQHQIDSIEHVGLVVKDQGDQVQTVEGNTDDAVRLRERDKSTIVGYGYPDYVK